MTFCVKTATVTVLREVELDVGVPFVRDRVADASTPNARTPASKRGAGRSSFIGAVRGVRVHRATARALERAVTVAPALARPTMRFEDARPIAAAPAAGLPPMITSNRPPRAAEIALIVRTVGLPPGRSSFAICCCEMPTRGARSA